MTKVTIGIITISLSLLTAFHLYGQQSTQETTNPLIGTWTWVETVNSNPRKITNHKEKPERLFAAITDTHSIYGMIDATTMQLRNVIFGCCYTLEGNKWTERWDFGPNAGKTFTFDLKIEGNKMFKTSTGGDGKGGQSIQVWERFKLPPKSPADKNFTSVGQQLLDLKKAKDAGAITDEEYQAQKAKLLGNK